MKYKNWLFICGLFFSLNSNAFQHINVTGVQTFHSINPQEDIGALVSGMLHVNIGDLFSIAYDAQQGIIATIADGGEVRIRVYEYDSNRQDGYGSLICEMYSRESSPDYEYQENSLTKEEQGDGSMYYPNPWHTGNIREAVFARERERGKTSTSLVPYDFLGESKPVVIQLIIKNATLKQFKVPGLGNFDAQRFYQYFNGYEYLKFKKIQVHVLDNPSDFNTAAYYKTRLEPIFNEVNNYYLNLTNKVKPSSVQASVGNMRLAFHDIDLWLYSGKADYANNEMSNILTKIAANFDENTLNLIFVKNFSFSPGYLLEGITHCTQCTMADLDLYQGKEYIVFSYGHLFDNSNVPTDGQPAATVAHEVGHFLNLEHPFGENTCSDNDHISDTPVASGTTWYLNASGNLIENPCDNAPFCNAQRRQIENLMDYGPCGWMFTAQQVAAMINMLKHKRGQMYDAFTYSNPKFNPFGPINLSVHDLRGMGMGGGGLVFRNHQEDTLPANAGIHTKLQVYPNPTDSQITIVFPKPVDAMPEIALTDAVGKVMKLSGINKKGISNIDRVVLNIERIPPGMYVLLVSIEGRKHFHKVVIGQK